MTSRKDAVYRISTALKEEERGGFFVLFRGQYRELPVVALPIEVPLYRPENGRLISQLRRYLHDRGEEEQAFAGRIDEPEVQQVLHELLVKLARDERGSIYAELREQAQQTEPLLLTRDGVVVNGNRRLAAMRTLLNENSERYASFKTLRVAVMPEETTPEDIEYVESALQLAPEVKLPYTWTNRRLKLRRQRDTLKLPVARILESYRLSDEESLVRELEEIELAETWLRDYRGVPGDYARIEECEELFIALNEQLRAMKEGDSRDFWRLAGFAMIEARGARGVNPLGYFPFAPPRPVQAPEQAPLRLAQARGIAAAEAESLGDSQRASLQRLLRQPDEAAALTRELTDILDQLRIEANYHEMPAKLLQHVQQARKLAEKIEAERLTAEQKAQIGSELAAIGYHSRRFLEDDREAPKPISPAQRKWRKLREDPQRFCRDSRNPLLRWLGERWPR